MEFAMLRNHRLRAASVVAALSAVVLVFAPQRSVAQTSGTWTNTAGGTWNIGGNWEDGAIASGSGAVADFSTLDIVGTQTATLNTAYTLGSLLFGDTTTSSSGSWVISNVVNVAADTSIGSGGSAADTTIFVGPMTLVGGTRTFTVVGSSMAYRGRGSPMAAMATASQRPAAGASRSPGPTATPAR